MGQLLSLRVTMYVPNRDKIALTLHDLANFIHRAVDIYHLLGTLGDVPEVLFGGDRWNRTSATIVAGPLKSGWLPSEQ